MVTRGAAKSNLELQNKPPLWQAVIVANDAIMRHSLNGLKKLQEERVSVPSFLNASAFWNAPRPLYLRQPWLLQWLKHDRPRLVLQESPSFAHHSIIHSTQLDGSSLWTGLNMGTKDLLVQVEKVDK